MNDLTKHGLKFKMHNGEPALENIIPFNPKAALHEAINRCLQGNPAQAIPVFQQVMQYPDCKKIAAINLANAYLDLMQLDKAIELALEYLKIEKMDTFGYQTLVKSYLKMGDLKSAEKYLIISNGIDGKNAMNHTLEMELVAYKNRFKEYWSYVAKEKQPKLYLGNQPFSFECAQLFNNQGLRPENHQDIFGEHTHTVENPVFMQPYELFQKVGYEYLEYTKKAWEGEDLNQKTLLMYSEQGLGDNIWLFGFIKKLKAKYDCKIHLATYDQLQCIAKKCEYIDKVLFPVFELDELIEADYICNIYKPLQFLSMEYEYPHVPQFTHKQLASPDNKKKVLVNWIAKSNLVHQKTLDLELFSSILNKHKDSMSFYVCQRDIEEDRIKSDIIRYSMPVEVISGQLTDLFSYVNDADLVITTDTLHVHVAGGLGKPTILLLCLNIAMPMWGKDLTTVPYYPTISIVRDLKTLTSFNI